MWHGQRCHCDQLQLAVAGPSGIEALLSAAFSVNTAAIELSRIGPATTTGWRGGRAPAAESQCIRPARSSASRNICRIYTCTQENK
jgi:hypothetical protein